MLLLRIFQYKPKLCMYVCMYVRMYICMYAHTNVLYTYPMYIATYIATKKAKMTYVDWHFYPAQSTLIGVVTFCCD